MNLFTFIIKFRYNSSYKSKLRVFSFHQTLNQSSL